MNNDRIPGFIRRLIAPIRLYNKPTAEILAARELVLAAIDNSPEHEDVTEWRRTIRILEFTLRFRRDLFDFVG